MLGLLQTGVPHGVGVGRVVVGQLTAEIHLERLASAGGLRGRLRRHNGPVK